MGRTLRNVAPKESKLSRCCTPSHAEVLLANPSISAVMSARFGITLTSFFSPLFVFVPTDRSCPRHSERGKACG